MADVARLPIHSPEAPVIPSRRTALFASLLLLAALPFGAAATPLGDLTALQRDGAAVTLTTSSGATVRLDFLRDDVLRLQAGPDGKLIDEGSGKAPHRTAAGRRGCHTRHHRHARRPHHQRNRPG